MRALYLLSNNHYVISNLIKQHCSVVTQVSTVRDETFRLDEQLRRRARLVYIYKTDQTISKTSSVLYQGYRGTEQKM